jgi:hypothetical protein
LTRVTRILYKQTQSRHAPDRYHPAPPGRMCSSFLAGSAWMPGMGGRRGPAIVLLLSAMVLNASVS